ncbi:MAG: terminase small subunit [Janthinobacterium lividum]
MSVQPVQDAPKVRKLTTQQQRFVEEYCVDWNCTQAALRAGYSEKTAYSIGWENLRKPEIKSAVDARLTELSLSAGQTTKLISEIAETRMNQFMRVSTVPVRQRKEGYANVVASSLREEIALVEEQASLLEKKDAAPLRRMLSKLRVQLVEMELEVQRHGKLAVVYVDGPLVLQEVVELDLVALAQAKEGGRIKSWTPTEHGIKVELYDAAAALRDMGRVHGIFEKDNSQAGAMAVLNTKVEIITTGPPIARSEKEVDDV